MPPFTSLRTTKQRKYYVSAPCPFGQRGRGVPSITAAAGAISHHYSEIGQKHRAHLAQNWPICLYYVRYFLVGAVFLSPIQGCTAGFQRSAPGDSTAPATPRSVVVRADWSDLEAAMEVSAPRAELGVLRTEKTEVRVRFEVVSATDELGEVVASRTAADGTASAQLPPGEDIEITLSARIGRFGDPVREGRILDALARRLTQLHNRATAPLDW